MSNGRGSRPPMEEVRGGTAAPRTCTQPIRSLGSTAWGWFRCWIRSGASCRFHEPPDAEPHVRWCGRTAGVIPPPTRSLCELVHFCLQSLVVIGTCVAREKQRVGLGGIIRGDQEDLLTGH